MFIGASVWIGNANDYEEFLTRIVLGDRIVSDLNYSHKCEDGDKVYYCFRPVDRKVDGALYVTADFMTRVLDVANVIVCAGRDNVIKFNGNGIIHYNWLQPSKIYRSFDYHRDKRRKASKFSMLSYRAPSAFTPLLEMLTMDGRETPYRKALRQW